MSFNTWIRDTVERTVMTVLQSAIVFILAADTLDTSWWKAALAATLPGAFNVIKQAVTTWMPTLTVWWQDAAWRTVSTFVVTVAGTAAAAGFDLFSASAWKVAALSGVTAGLALLKSIIAKRYPYTDTLTPASFARAA